MGLKCDLTEIRCGEDSAGAEEGVIFDWSFFFDNFQIDVVWKLMHWMLK